MPVHLAVSIPQLVPDHRFDAEATRAYLARAETLGFTGAWTTEQVLGTAPNLDPVALLGFAAAHTTRLRLGCAVWVSTLMSPLHLAKSLASLDQISRGRLEVGLGTGGGFRAFAAFGLEPDHYLSRFTEGLRVMRAAWSEERFDLDGPFFRGENLAVEPKPFQRPAPPVWFGGGHPNSLRRAVRLADGFIGAGSTTTVDFLAQVQILRDELDRAGRDPATFRIGKRVYLAVGDDPAGERERLTKALSGLYAYFGMRDLGRLGTAGTAEQVTDELRRIAETGVDLLVLNPLFDEAEQLERLSADVVPSLAP